MPETLSCSEYIRVSKQPRSLLLGAYILVGEKRQKIQKEVVAILESDVIDMNWQAEGSSPRSRKSRDKISGEYKVTEYLKNQKISMIRT